MGFSRYGTALEHRQEPEKALRQALFLIYQSVWLEQKGSVIRLHIWRGRLLREWHAESILKDGGKWRMTRKELK